jgi:tRNA (Thr-GGU) A37 N-methylase
MADVYKDQPGYIFAFFAFMMVLQLVWVTFWVPETKGVTLEQMQKKLGIEDEMGVAASSHDARPTAV